MNERVSQLFTRIKTYIKLPQAIFFLLLPGILLLVGLIVEWTFTLNRFDPDYFTPALAEKYANPQETVIMAQEAIAAGDAAMLAELQGLNTPREVETNPNLTYVFPYEVYVGHRRLIVSEDPEAWDRMESMDNRFVSYLFADTVTNRLVPLIVEPVNGRWVFVNDERYFYMQTGTWTGMLGTLTPIYYLFYILRFVWVYMDGAKNARLRAYEEREQARNGS